MFKKLFPPIENERNQSPQDPGYINIQRAFWVSIIFTAVAVISMGLGIYLVFKYPYWQIYAILVIAALSTVFDVLAVVLIRRGRAGISLKILYWSGLITLPLNSLLVPGVAPVLAAIVMVMGFVNIYLLFPRTWRRFALVGPITAALFMLLVDYLNPPFRYSMGVLPTSGFFGPFILAFLVVSIVFLIVRQAWPGIMRLLRRSIRNRLTAIILVVTIPLLVGITIYISSSAGSEITAESELHLQEKNDALLTNLSTWLELHKRTLQEITLLPDIVSMDPARQIPVLKAVAAAHPNLFLVHTINLDGMNVARNDDAAPKDYSDRQWFLGAKNGNEITYELVISRTTGRPALNMSMPIRNGNGQIVGVLSIASQLDEISREVITTEEGGIVFIVNENNLVVAHPDPSYTEGEELYDMSAYPPVVALRSGHPGAITFKDENGIVWRAYTSRMDNGWAIVAQQPETVLLMPVQRFQIPAGILIIVGVVTMFVLAWFAIRRTLQPISTLTQTVTAIAEGDLNREVKVTTQDEIGELASAFSTMTSQVRGLIGTLEQRVAERTQSLALAADVGRSVSQVRALDVMLKDAAEIIRSRFDLYYTQVYLTNPTQTELVLQAGTGTVGAELLGRSHRLLLNTGSINGRAAMEKRSVVISDTMTSVSFRPNPLLPDTRSEMAVPLMVGEKVVGVLDLQSRTAGALSEDMLPAFEALAGQLAIAIQNASLLAEAEQARADVETQARRFVRSSWADYLDAIHKPEHTGFMFEQDQIKPLDNASEVPAENAVTAPIAVTGESIGSIVVELDAEKQTTKNVELVNTIARQVAQQVENLRLLESTERYRIEAEQAVQRVTREGWKTYLESAGGKLGYMYDLKEVVPMEPDRKASDNAITLPINVRDEAVGKIALTGVDQNDGQSLELATAVAERLSAHIESLRQFSQTQSALAQSEKLFEASRELTQSTDLQGLVKATVEALSIPEIDRAILGVLHYDSNNEPDGMNITANWASGTELPATPVGTYYPKEALKTLSLFMGPEPLFFNDMLNDERIDEKMKDIPRRLNYRSVAALPLFAGTRHDSVLLLEGKEPHKFTQDEMRLFAALAPQIATVMENRRQYEQAQKQAERESTLNVISQKIQSATTVEAVLQIAARELGHALGAPLTIAQLGIKEK